MRGFISNPTLLGNSSPFPAAVERLDRMAALSQAD
jgi:hypothetical protein